jgi:hypothetical protein
MAAGGRTTDHAPETIYRALTVVELDTRANKLPGHLRANAIGLALAQAICVGFLLGARWTSALAFDFNQRSDALFGADARPVPFSEPCIANARARNKSTVFRAA